MLENEQMISFKANYQPSSFQRAKNTVDSIEAELKLNKTVEKLETIGKLIDIELHKIKQIIFQNKSVTFLKKQQINENFLREENTITGKLLIMNHFFTDSGFKMLLE